MALLKKGQPVLLDSTRNKPPLKTQSTYIYGLALLYFIASWVGISHHELWLDESHHWLLARDSGTFTELVKNTRYEGHPILWNIVLYWISRFTLNPFWMQILHICISTSVVILFLRKAPFSWVFKTLFIFGYFIFFEYNLISRNYILGIFFLFLACSVYKSRHSRFLSFSLFLAAAANVHLMFIVIALAFFLTALYENFRNGDLFEKKYIPGYVIFITGLLLAIIQIIPPDDTLFFTHAQEIPFREKFVKGFISLFKGLVTIPDFSSIHFWNSNALVNISKTLSGLIGLLAYALPIILFYKNRKTLFFVYIALIGTNIFFFVTQLGATRYDGMTYLIIIIALWIEKYYPVDDYKLKQILDKASVRLLKGPIVYSILVIHFFSGIFAFAMDYRNAFTSSKETVAYLKNNKFDRKKIVTVSCDGTSLSAYLEKKVYFLCNNSYQSYCRWNSNCQVDISENNIIPLVTDLMIANDTVIFVSNISLVPNPKPGVWNNLGDDVKIRFYKKFDPTIVRRAGYSIFEVVRKPKKD